MSLFLSRPSGRRTEYTGSRFGMKIFLTLTLERKMNLQCYADYCSAVIGYFGKLSENFFEEEKFG